MALTVNGELGFDSGGGAWHSGSRLRPYYVEYTRSRLKVYGLRLIRFKVKGLMLKVYCLRSRKVLTYHGFDG